MEEELLAAARDALTRPQNRWTPAQVNAYISQNSQFGSIDELQSAVQGGGEGRGSKPQTQGEFNPGVRDLPQALADFGVLAARGASGRTIDEITSTIAGLAGGVGALLPGGETPKEGFQRARGQASRNFREVERQAGERAGLAGLIPEALGSLLPAAGAARAVGVGAKGVPFLQTLGRGTTLPARIVTGAGQGATIGAAENALFQVGGGEGSVGERVRNIDPLEFAIATLFGGAAGGAGGLVGGIRSSRAAVEGGSDRVASATRSGSGVRGDRPRIEGQVATAREVGGEFIENTGDLAFAADIVSGSRPIMTALRSVANKSDEAAKLLDDIDNPGPVALRRPPRRPSIRLALELRDEIAKVADGTTASAREAQTALAQIDDTLNGIPDLRRGQSLLDLADAQENALKLGEDMFGANRRVMRSRFDNLDTDVERVAFREGLASRRLQAIEQGDQTVKSFIEKFRTGAEVADELEIIFDAGRNGTESGRQALAEFRRFIDAEAATISRAEMSDAIAKTLGFLFGGTSITGPLILESG